MKKWRITFGILCITVLFLLCHVEECRASETETQEELLKFYEFQQMDDYVSHFSFSGLVLKLVNGDIKGAIHECIQGVKEGLLDGIRGQAKLAGQIIALGITSAVFMGTAQLFSSRQISNTGYYAIYLLLFTCMATGFLSALDMAQKIADLVFEYMKILMPSYALAVALTGNISTSTVVFEYTMMMMTALQFALNKIVFPIIKLYFLLTVVSHLTKEDMMSKMSKLLQDLVSWGMKTIVGAVIGFHLIQGMILPYKDAVKSNAAKKFIGMLPGIGTGANAVTKLLLGSGILIKNAIGVAGIVVLVGIILVPILKLLVLFFLYQCIAVMLQPVCDKRIVEGISDTATGMKMVFSVVCITAFIFILSIALTCSATNVPFYTA